MYTLFFNQNPFLVVLNAMELIPNLKDGKIGTAEMVSYLKDLQFWRIWKQKYIGAESKLERTALIKNWNYYISLREEEDYIPISHSKNQHIYLQIFH